MQFCFTTALLMMWQVISAIFVIFVFLHRSYVFTHTITIRYDTRYYFNVRSKADMSQLNLYRTETTTKNCKTEKLKSKNRYARRNSKRLGNHVVSSEEEKERLQ